MTPSPGSRALVAMLFTALAGCGAEAGGPPCEDTFMGAHSTELLALELASTTASDDDWLTSGSHTIGACGNVHYYRVDATDKPLYAVNPTVSSNNPDLRMCMFFSCKMGASEVQCRSSVPGSSENGLQGCCGRSSQAISADFDCDDSVVGALGISDASAYVYLRVDRLGAAAVDAGLSSLASVGADPIDPDGCTSYELTFNF